MKNVIPLLCCLVCSVFLASCASEKTVTNKKARATSGLDKYNSNYEYTKDKDGMMRAVSDEQSQYDNKAAYTGGRDFGGKDYNKSSYRKQRWGQNKEFNSQAYSGNTDGSKYKYSPHYVKQQAIAAGKTSRYSGSNYGTGAYSAGRAGEGSTASVKKGESSYVTSQGSYGKPRIMSKKQYTNMNVKETNKLLGR